MILYILTVKNSYLIQILLKNSNFFLEEMFTIFYTISLKHKNVIHDLNLKWGSKVAIEFFFRD